jgi:hypothetical protein
MKESEMDSTILAAIIGGFSTLGAGIVAVLVTRVVDNPMGFKKNPRQAALAGHWDGIVHQEGGLGDYHITFQLKPTGRTVRGEGRVSFISQNANINELLTFSGGFVHDRFLKLEYEMEAQPGSVQFGFTLLELSPNGQTLSGPFLGYGARTRDLIKGTLELHRQGAGAIPQASSSSQKTI